MYEVPYNGSLANIFTSFAEHHVNVDIIVQTILEDTQPSVSFSIKKEDFAETINVLEKTKKHLAIVGADFKLDLLKSLLLEAEWCLIRELLRKCSTRFEFHLCRLRW